MWKEKRGACASFVAIICLLHEFVKRLKSAATDVKYYGFHENVSTTLYCGFRAGFDLIKTDLSGALRDLKAVKN